LKILYRARMNKEAAASSECLIFILKSYGAEMKRKEKNCQGNQETWMGRKGDTEVEAA